LTFFADTLAVTAVDTSADRDFVGGNAVLAKAGRNIMAAGTEPLGEFERGATNTYPATIVSTEQILSRMSALNGQKAPYPSEAWPQETFPDRRKDYYMNHEGIQIYREPPAHSDSDSIVLFRGSDVVVTGDIIDANRFPVIDIANGGSIQGEIEALNEVVDLSLRPMPFVFAEGGTLVVTGHGRLYDRQDVVEYRDMVVTIRDIIQDMMQRGMTLPQIKEAAPAKAAPRCRRSTSPAGAAPSSRSYRAGSPTLPRPRSVTRFTSSAATTELRHSRACMRRSRERRSAVLRVSRSDCGTRQQSGRVVVTSSSPVG